MPERPTIKKCGSSPQVLELQLPEKTRIMRALYIIEVFFNLFRQTSIPETVLRQCMNDFLLNFAHVEQIACVHDFLFFQVSPVFNEMAAHDVFWGEFQVEPAQWFGSPELQYVLFKGLVALESIAKAKTYSRQQELFDRGQVPSTRHHNLYTALRDYSHEGSNMQELPVSSFDTPQDYASSVKRPYFEDCDQAPFAIWKWAHMPVPLDRSVYHRNQAMLRRRGYVMWSQARLDMLDVLQDEWQPQVVRNSPPDDPVHEVTDEKWLSSWRERSLIYEKGGRGWWDFGDESRVVWSRCKKEPAKARNAPESLEEAKRAILALKQA